MLFTEENELIYKLYSSLLRENPDTLSIGDSYYSYDESELGNIPGLITKDGRFILCRSAVGHWRLLDAIRNKELEKFGDVRHNFKDLEEIYQYRDGFEKIRLWPKFKVFSFWFRIFNPIYKAAVNAVLNEIGDGSKLYQFDLNRYDDEFISYDDLMSTELSEKDKEELGEAERREAEDKRRLADAILGNTRKPSIDYDDILPQRKPAWMTREGD